MGLPKISCPRDLKAPLQQTLSRVASHQWVLGSFRVPIELQLKFNNSPWCRLIEEWFSGKFLLNSRSLLRECQLLNPQSRDSSQTLTSQAPSFSHPTSIIWFRKRDFFLQAPVIRHSRRSRLPMCGSRNGLTTRPSMALAICFRTAQLVCSSMIPRKYWWIQTVPSSSTTKERQSAPLRSKM